MNSNPFQFAVPETSLFATPRNEMIYYHFYKNFAFTAITIDNMLYIKKYDSITQKTTLSKVSDNIKQISRGRFRRLNYYVLHEKNDMLMYSIIDSHTGILVKSIMVKPNYRVINEKIDHSRGELIIENRKFIRDITLVLPDDHQIFDDDIYRIITLYKHGNQELLFISITRTVWSKMIVINLTSNRIIDIGLFNGDVKIESIIELCGSDELPLVIVTDNSIKTIIDPNDTDMGTDTRSNTCIITSLWANLPNYCDMLIETNQ